MKFSRLNATGRNNFKMLGLSVAVTTLMLSNVSYAHDMMTNDDHAHTEGMTHDLGTIVITASADDTQGVRMVRDPKQPIQPAPASDGAAYLKSLMGFNAVQSGGVNGDVTFRGMFGSRIKLLNNGTENLGACPSRMDNPATYIAPENYDKITVIKGPQSVEFATPGSAATVQFERKKPDFSDRPNDAKVGYQGNFSTLVGSFGRWDHNLDMAVGNEQFYSRINANRSASNDYEDGQGTRVHGAWMRWNSDLTVGFTPNKDTTIELTAGTGDGEVAYAGRAMDGSQYKRTSYGLNVEKTNITPLISKVEAKVNYNNNDHIMDNFSLRKPQDMGMMNGGSMPNHGGHGGHGGHNAPNMGGNMSHGNMGMSSQMAMRVTRETLNSRIAMQMDGDKWQLKTGLDSQRNNHGGEMYSPTMASMNMPYQKNMKYQSFGGFAELSYDLNPEHRMIVGGRADQVKIDALKTMRMATPQQRKDTLPSGFIRHEYDNGAGLSTYAGVGHVERSPDYWELMGGNVSNRAENFSQLRNEKTTQLDVGFKYDMENWNAWASAYAGQVKDFMLMSYVDKSNKKSKNVDARIAGAEAGIAYQFSPEWSADVNAMYAWGKNTTDNQALPQISPFETRFNVRYSQDNYNVGLLWRAVAAQNRVALNQGNVVGYDVKPSKAFNILSLNGSYDFNDKVNLSAGIDNLTNRTYIEHLNRLGDAGTGLVATEQFNNIGRNYWTRLNVKF
ncbi:MULTISPECIES: TonB-dependent receptor domain-containing protein [unclassified Acinetobacter]|uniref:TonB-dependent receptor domain-containing protein n=1 Tax=unclassified Acinetobacter TaxID=196816 RepID=UPI0035B9F6A4